MDKKNSSNTKNSNKNIKNQNKESTRKSKESLEKGIQGKNPFQVKRFQRYMRKADATCLILKANKDFGTGFFCEIKINETKLKGLFTCNHILNQNDIKKGSKINIIIKDIGKMIDIKKCIEITNERFTCTNEDLNYSFIRIFNDEPYNNFFQIDNQINCKNPYEIYKLYKNNILYNRFN